MHAMFGSVCLMLATGSLVLVTDSYSRLEVHLVGLLELRPLLLLLELRTLLLTRSTSIWIRGHRLTQCVRNRR